MPSAQRYLLPLVFIPHPSPLCFAMNTDLLHSFSTADAGVPFLIALLSLLWLSLFIRRWINNINSGGAPPLPPGPTALPLVGNLLSLDPELHTYFNRLAKSYGPIYRLKLGTKTAIIVASSAVAKEVLKDNDTTFANRCTLILLIILCMVDLINYYVFSNAHKSQGWLLLTIIYLITTDLSLNHDLQI